MLSLLARISSKNFLHKPIQRPLTHGIRRLSSYTNPYLMHCVTSFGEEDFPEAGSKPEMFMYDPAKEELFIVDDKPLPKEMVQSRLVGSSHGYGVYLKSPWSIFMSDYCKPSSSKSNPKIIPLSPRFSVNDCQTELVSGVAMSSSPEEEDCVTAIKYTGGLVIIHTPGLDNKGIILFVSNYFEQSKLMYSKRDQMFYMVSSGGHHLLSWDGLLSSKPQFHDLRYALSLPTKTIRFDSVGTEGFMVFREEEDMNMCYTQDIGDLCIFLGHNEPFCVKASSFPGLNPNSIYFAGNDGYGVYDIATRSLRSFNPKFPSEFDCSPSSTHVTWFLTGILTGFLHILSSFLL